MITDPWFYAAALPIVFLVGLSKGGFLTGLGLLGVPLLSLVVPPTVAAGILLPVLLAMDCVSVWSYRKTFDKAHLAVMLPSSIAGLGIGWLTAAYVTEGHIAIIVGVIGLVFMFYNSYLKFHAMPSHPVGGTVGRLLSVGSGFTSFISHAGGPLAQVYLQPQKLPPVMFAGTMTMCFAALNLIKVVPFMLLGMINIRNFEASVMLFPMAVVAALCGVWMAKHVSQERFYFIANVCLAIVSVELIRAGVLAVMRH